VIAKKPFLFLLKPFVIVSYMMPCFLQFSCLFDSCFILILILNFTVSFFYCLAVIAKKLAVEPLERMLAVVDIVSLSLNAFKRDG